MKKNIIIAGGGTGGHVYPALAIARSLQSLDAQSSVHFVGTTRGIEGRVIPQNNFPIHFINVGRLNSNVSLFERLKTLVQLPFAIFKGFFLLFRLKPAFVLGVGGYASAPILLAASIMGYKTVIWEPNAIPGLANRWLSRFVDQCWVVFKGATKYLKNKNVQLVGVPIREEIERLGTLATKDGVSPIIKNILIFGGSQGARGINKVIIEAFEKGADWSEGLKFVHQTGVWDFEDLRDRYSLLDLPNVEVYEFLEDMEKRYAWADLVICRAGTGTISELAAAGKAALLVPLPTAADNHQLKNAQELHGAKAALFVEQKDFDAEFLVELIEKIKQEPQSLMILENNIKSFGRPKASEEIAQKLLNL